MNAREEILARIRAAGDVAPSGPASVGPSTAVEPTSVVESTSVVELVETRIGPTPAVDPSPAVELVETLVDLFVDRVRDYRAVVEHCPNEELAARIDAIVAGRAVVVPPGLDIPVTGAVVDGGAHAGVDNPLTAAQLDAIDVVVTAARLGIAETGTVVLDHAPDQGRRALTLVPDTHVCVVRADQLVPDVPQAVAALDPRRPTTWISGPSATSDIELDRVEGVHGPRNLHVLLVPASSPSSSPRDSP